MDPACRTTGEQGDSDSMPGALTIARIVDQLAVLGVGHGDTLMVHASLRAVGPVAAAHVSVHWPEIDARGTA